VKQTLYYNKYAKDLKLLEEGDVVRMKPFQLGGDNVWIKGATIRCLDERSYEVESPSGILCTNHAPHLCKTNEPSTLSNFEADANITIQYTTICKSRGESQR